MSSIKSSLSTAVFVSVMLLAACAGSTETTSPAQSLLRFFPEDTSGVVFINFGDLRDQAFIGSLVEQNAGIETPEELSEFEAATGFDFERDVRQLMAGSAGEGRSLIVVDAMYDLDRVVDYLTGEGMRSGDYQGTPLFRPDAEEEARVAFLGDVAVIGGEAEVRSAIDRLAGSSPSALDNAQLLADVEEVGQGGYQVWATGRIDPEMIPDQAGGGAMELLSALERGTYQMRFDDAITARAIAEFSSPDQARTAASLLEGLRGMAMIQGAATEFGDLLSEILIANNESRVEIQLNVDTAVLERLAESGALSR
jgi:hypothetical protein